jgi:hypothetical protein
MQHLLPNNNHARKRRLLPLADKEKHFPAAGPWPVFSALFFIVHTFLNFVFMKAPFKHALLIIAGTLLCLFHSCKPEPEPQKYLGNYPLGEVKDYLYFKPGSYWVYECDSTGELDSQVIRSIDTPWFHLGYIDYQLLMYNRESIPFRTKFNTYYPTVISPYCEKCQRGFRNVLNIVSPFGSATDCVFYYPFDSTVAGGGGSSPTYYKGYLDSLQVLGKWYKDVRVFQVQYAGGFVEPRIKTWGDGQITYYWAKNIGVVRVHVWTKKDGFDTTFKFNWNLKRYFIP